MQRILRYLTHPQVQIDPEIPVPEWGLSDLGRERTFTICNAAVLNATVKIASSSETKAVETGSIIADALGLDMECRELMHENDRSGTGFLEPSEFEEVANQFFAHPNISVRGWERAVDAQSRIVSEANTVLEKHGSGDILLVGHGGVGTLLYCHFAGLPISRSQDQLPGGGCYFSYDIDEKRVLHHWKVMEEFQ